MTKTLNVDMKRTLFEISLNHAKNKKRPLSLKGAGMIIRNYQKMFYFESSKNGYAVSEEDLRTLTEMISVNTNNEIMEFLDSLFQ